MAPACVDDGCSGLGTVYTPATTTAAGKNVCGCLSLDEVTLACLT